MLVAGAAALSIWAPVASADDPPQCAPDDQQCQDQQKQQQGAAIADQVIDDTKQRVDQVAQRAIDPNTGEPYGPRLFHFLVNGAEACWPVTTPLNPLDKVVMFPGDPDGLC